MNDSIACDVVILPDPALAEAAITASEKLRQFDGFFVLKDGEYFPHASLYMLQLKIGDLPKVAAALSEIAKSTAILRLQAYRFDQTLGYIDAEYEKTPELTSLQQRVLGALNPLRDGMRQKDVERMKEAEGPALENYRKYGFKSVGELYRPHMTFARLKSDNPAALEALGGPDEFSGDFLRLGLFEMGDNGTCVRQIGAFDFLS